jgi:hypothetical protein
VEATNQKEKKRKEKKRNEENKKPKPEDSFLLLSPRHFSGEVKFATISE